MKNRVEDYLKIKSKFKYFVFLVLYFILFPISRCLYGSKKLFLVCERGYDAQDNGFIFYKYLCENHKDIKPVYIISKKSPELDKVKAVGKYVYFCSIKHFLMVIGCRTKISSHLFGYAPWIQMETFFRRNRTKDKHIFLQHGIIKNFHESLCGQCCKSLSLFVCGAKPEYDYIKKTFGYTPKITQYTGLARYDNLQTFKTNNIILFMPTWRMDLSKCSDEEFKKSAFYSNWSNILNNKELIQACKQHDLQIVFYLHFSFQQFSKLFRSNDVVKIVSFGDKTVQELLKESKLLVTDFSSVYFDFCYMKKPIIYFQFDEDTFNQKHYSAGYFDYRRDGFGCVVNHEKEAVFYILKYINSNFCVEKKYLNRRDRFFIYNDTNNCERIFNAISNI